MTDEPKKLVLNLGCGTTVSDKCVNIDWSSYTRISNNWLLRPVARLLVGPTRITNYDTICKHVKFADLRRGIPYPSSSVDAVYHSHFLEHLDRNSAPSFLSEIYRVLKPGGVQRIVVPDLAKLVDAYLASFKERAIDHDHRVAEMFEQSVRREASGTKMQRPLRRSLENLILGNARARGETHQWMYDEVNLEGLLKEAGFSNVNRVTYDQSSIDSRWSNFGLDVNSNGNERKPDSLYLEALK